MILRALFHGHRNRSCPSRGQASAYRDSGSRRNSRQDGKRSLHYFSIISNAAIRSGCAEHPRCPAALRALLRLRTAALICLFGSSLSRARRRWVVEAGCSGLPSLRGRSVGCNCLAGVHGREEGAEVVQSACPSTLLRPECLRGKRGWLGMCPRKAALPTCVHNRDIGAVPLTDL